MMRITNKVDVRLHQTSAHASIDVQVPIGEYLRQALKRLEAAELLLVARAGSITQRRPMRWLVMSLNRLGDGWLYPVLILSLLLLGTAQSRAVLFTAVLAVGCAHLVYPFIKAAVRRNRPFVSNPALVCVSTPLDTYSFPSGHCMTLTAVLVPVGCGYAGIILVGVAFWTLVAWARIASGHHYPSDVVAGTALGAVIAWPLSIVVIG